MVAAAFLCGKGDSMSKEPFEALPDVMDAKQLAEALQISKAGAYNLLSSPDFPTLRIGGRKLVMKNELVEWLKNRTNKTS
jgi:predicted DNA-binding transcriptional regulator AlpA